MQKVYTKLVMDIESGAILEEDSYLYEGPMAECKGGSPAPPEPTAEERALQQEQLAILREQREQNRLLEPYIMDLLGLKVTQTPREEQYENPAWTDWNKRYNNPTYYVTSLPENGGDGSTVYAGPAEPERYMTRTVYDRSYTPYTEEERLAKMTPEEKMELALKKKQMLLQGMSETGEQLTEEQMLAGMTPLEKANYEIQKAYNDRTQKALAGNLPVSDATERALTTKKAELVSELEQKLGKDWATSTPGIQAMGEFESEAELVRDAERRGDLSMSEGLTANRAGISAQEKSELADLMGTAYNKTLNRQSTLFQLPERYNSMLGNTSAALNPMRNERMSMYDYSVSSAMQNNANKSAQTTGMVSAGTALASAAIMAVAL